MPKPKTSNKISVSSGTAADIFTDLEVSQQAIQRAQTYIAVSTKSLKLRGYPATILVSRKDLPSGKVILVRKVAGKDGTSATTIPRKKAAKRKVAKRKVARKKVSKRKVAKRKIAKKKVAKKKVSKRKVAKRKIAKKKVAKRKTTKRKAAKRKV